MTAWELIQELTRWCEPDTELIVRVNDNEYEVTGIGLDKYIRMPYIEVSE